ncbi:hypothetical protein MKW92_039756 [Papaver armeniacum]|nr:hypothetical protein MKW92_039756 [Papaver armeniacum]
MKHRGLWRSGAIYAVLVDIYGQYGVQLSPNMFCALANGYAQQGLCEQTVKILQLMETEGIEPNLIMLNLLINVFGIAGRHLEGISPDVVTYSTLMKAFYLGEKVLRIYEEMQSAGCTPDRKARELLQTASGVLEKRQGRGSKP